MALGRVVVVSVVFQPPRYLPITVSLPHTGYMIERIQRAPNRLARTASSYPCRQKAEYEGAVAGELFERSRASDTR